MAAAAQEKWSSGLSFKLSGVKPDQIWVPLSDFCNIHKWVPNVDSSDCVEGTVGEVGVVRRCIFKPIPSPDGGTGEWIGSVDEKLVKLDQEGRSLIYQVLENNFGVPAGTYFGTETVSETASGCKYEWSFKTPPIVGWTLEEFRAFIGGHFKTMLDVMAAAAKPTAA